MGLIWRVERLSSIVVLIIIELLLPHHLLLLHILPVLLFNWPEIIQVLVHFIWVAIQHFIEPFCRHLLVLCVDLRLFVLKLLPIVMSILRPLLSFSQKEMWCLNLLRVVTSYRWGHLWLLLLVDPLFITPVALKPSFIPMLGILSSHWHLLRKDPFDAWIRFKSSILGLLSWHKKVGIWFGFGKDKTRTLAFHFLI